MREKNRGSRLLRSLLALICAAVLLCAETVPAAAKVTQADIDVLKGDASDLSAQKKKIEAELSALAGDKRQALARKNKLDEQVANTSARIANAEQQISDYTALIAQAETELTEAEAKEETQYKLFCRRVRAMEKQGTVNYWAVLFRAASFADLLGRLSDINEVMSADQKVIDDLQALQVQIAETKQTLEENKVAAEEARVQLVSQKQELNAQRAEAEALVAEIDDNESDYEDALADLKAEEARIQNEIKELNRKLEEQQKAEGQSYNSNPGGYIWPVDSRYITSTVGGRTSPGGIGSTNHKGTDIGRVGYTSSVYASKSGTVIVSTRSSSYGNYIVISHGSGNTTLYAHLSSRSVSVGDKVQQGQTIGVTGSTGHSTGPHLHFEIMENNVIVNPLSHGKKPQMGYLTGYTLSGSA